MGYVFLLTRGTGGVPSSARKKESRSRTTTDCARLTPAIIITSAAILIRMRIPREELICSVIVLCDYSFSFK